MLYSTLDIHAVRCANKDCAQDAHMWDIMHYVKAVYTLYVTYYTHTALGSTGIHTVYSVELLHTHTTATTIRFKIKTV
jgi:hypothetical protein